MLDDRVTFCRICEAHCGLVATVEDGRVTRLRPDREHPLSRGYACPKGIAMTEVQNDPDRVVHPLRRRAGTGEFERVSWEEAMDDIGRRLRAVLERHGPASVGFVQWTDAVVAPRGEAREEWEIIRDLAHAAGVEPYSVPALRRLARLGVALTPRRLASLLLRTGPAGDRLGLRPRGLSLAWLRRHPHGVVTGRHLATGVLPRRLRHRDSRVHLHGPEVAGELRRLAGVDGHDPAYPLRLIGLRELRSHNSWMHNAPLLMRGGRTHALRVHPDDARANGLHDGGTATIASKSGSPEVPVTVTDEMKPGTVALPHGWGHRGGWKLANAAGGVNVNVLASGEPEDLEPLAGMAFLNGIPVRVTPVAAREVAAAGGAAGVARVAGDPG